MKTYIEKLKKIKNYPILVVFLAIIFIFTIIDIVKPDKEFSDLENKYLQQRPEFSLSSLYKNEFTPKYEKYINEQFMFRNKWIDLKSRAEIYIGKTENNGIVYGKDGYLFDKITVKNQEQIDKNIQHLKKFVEKYSDEKISIALIPNSFEVLSEKVPFGLNLLNQSKVINEVYSEFMDYNNVNTVDIVAALLENKDKYIYYKTDHHWTTLGAYYAYSYIMNQMNRTIVNIDEIDYNKVEFFLGTYYSKAKKYNAEFDYINFYNIDVESITIGDEVKESIYNEEKYKERDKYAAFLHGNSDLTIIKSKNQNKDGKISRIIVFKDSFGNSFVPFLTYSFDEIYVVDLRANKKMVSEIMELVDYDEVLFLYNINNFSEDNNILRLGF